MQEELEDLIKDHQFAINSADKRPIVTKQRKKEQKGERKRELLSQLRAVSAKVLEARSSRPPADSPLTRAGLVPPGYEGRPPDSRVD